MGTIERHPAISNVRPDEIAECWEGVYGVQTEDGGLYEALWSFVPNYTDPSPEESEEPIIGGNDSIENFWEQLAESHQKALNELVVKQFWYEEGE